MKFQQSDTLKKTVFCLFLLFLGLTSASITHAAPNAYVANDYSKSVTVIDSATDNHIATVGVGDNPVGVVVTHDGNTAYVTNSGSDTVSVIDTSTNNVKDNKCRTCSFRSCGEL